MSEYLNVRRNLVRTVGFAYAIRRALQDNHNLQGDVVRENLDMTYELIAEGLSPEAVAFVLARHINKVRIVEAALRACH